MFRAGLLGPLLQISPLRALARRLDRSTDGQRKKRIARLLGIGSHRRDSEVWGVEINVDAHRTDVFVGSFDALPESWTGRFDLLFSNSFDHSMNPTGTVAEWKRVAAPGAVVAIDYDTDREPTRTDPTGGLTLEVLQDLWQARVLFSEDRASRNGYDEVIFQL